MIIFLHDERYFIVDEKVTNAIDEIIQNADDMTQKKLDNIVRQFETEDAMFDIGTEESKIYSWDDNTADISLIN